MCFLIYCYVIFDRDGNEAGRDQRMGSSSPPRMVLSCLIPHDGKNFLTSSPPLGTPRRPASPHLTHPVKLYFLLICLTTSTIFLKKPISLIKIYLKLQLNLSHQIK